MKDLYDIWLLLRSYEFDGDGLARAIAATFARRKTSVPVEPPFALTPAFAEDPTKRQQWLSFAESIDAKVPALAVVVEELAAFLMPHATKARTTEKVGSMMLR